MRLSHVERKDDADELVDSDTGDDMLGVSGASAIHAGNVDVLVLAAART